MQNQKVEIVGYEIFINGYELSEMLNEGISGKGKTAAEAITDCFREIQPVLDREMRACLSDTVSVPLREVPNLPKEVPSGKVLLVCARINHSSGETYDFRFLAIDPGNHKFGAHGVIVDVSPLSLYTVDSNSFASFKLPDGSLKYCTGKWVEVKYLSYDY